MELRERKSLSSSFR